MSKIPLRDNIKILILNLILNDAQYFPRMIIRMVNSMHTKIQDFLLQQ